MASNKRMKYVYDNEGTTSEEESCEDVDYMPNNKSRAGRKPKCFSKNALLARENRLKKKIYITNLENDVTSLKKENKKLASVVDNQSFLIADLKRQLRYFKSVVANSSDISTLIRNIHQNTGMSVSSSLDKNLSLKNVCVPKPKQPIARKTAHPWDETNYPSYPTPESNYLSSPDALRGDELTEMLNDIPLDFPIDIKEHELMDSFDFKDNIEINPSDTLSEHNYYTTTIPKEVLYNDDGIDDVGVCLHVSKHRLSLEFCPTCSENAARSWLE
ncbi:uncharacterized protein LOC108917767 [Anoplophora glabripennis]|uniref:uncharacterized protein LOC108917767 n=1 Tax=Anoplophora glabripennis TaxID=217634 RepID=UPI000C772D5D|nr:uncharacterized protein LOC108917767 [Anoplophora glabripennis]